MTESGHQKTSFSAVVERKAWFSIGMEEWVAPRKLGRHLGFYADRFDVLCTGLKMRNDGIGEKDTEQATPEERAEVRRAYPTLRFRFDLSVQIFSIVLYAVRICLFRNFTAYIVVPRQKQRLILLDCNFGASSFPTSAV